MNVVSSRLLNSTPLVILGALSSILGAWILGSAASFHAPWWAAAGIGTVPLLLLSIKAAGVARRSVAGMAAAKVKAQQLYEQGVWQRLFGSDEVGDLGEELQALHDLFRACNKRLSIVMDKYELINPATLDAADNAPVELYSMLALRNDLGIRLQVIGIRDDLRRGKFEARRSQLVWTAFGVLLSFPVGYLTNKLSE